MGQYREDSFGFFPGLSREEGDFWRDFGAEMEFGGEIWGAGRAA